MGYTEAKYGIKQREFLTRKHSEITEGSDVAQMTRVFPGAINITKLGFISGQDNATQATRVQIALYRDKHSTTFATIGVGGLQNSVLATGAINSALVTTGTIVAGSYLTCKFVGTSATPMHGVVFFDYVVPFVLEDADDKWDGSS